MLFRRYRELVTKQETKKFGSLGRIMDWTSILRDFMQYGMPGVTGAAIAWIVLRAGQSHDFEKESWKRRQEDISEIARRLEMVSKNDAARVRRHVQLFSLNRGEKELVEEQYRFFVETEEIADEMGEIKARLMLLGFMQEAEIAEEILSSIMLNESDFLQVLSGRKRFSLEDLSKYADQGDAIRKKLMQNLSTRYNWNPRPGFLKSLKNEIESWRVQS